MRLLLLGATGLVGRCTLEQALSTGTIDKILAPTRTPLAPNAKLSNPVAANIEQLISDLSSFQPTAVICALGTTRAKAGSIEAFYRIDHDMPVAFSRAAHVAGARTCAIVTVMGASVTSGIFYLRTKGEVERDIQTIGFHSLTICRPNLIDGERSEHRAIEAGGLFLARSLAPILPKRFRPNPAGAIAAALLDAVIAARTGCSWVRADEMN